MRIWAAVVVFACVLLTSGAGTHLAARNAGTTRYDAAPLVLIGDIDYPPLSYMEDGSAKGVDVDVARALAPILGREVRIVLMNWAAAQNEVLAGRANGLLSMSATREREQLYDFTEPTLHHEFSLFVRSQGPWVSTIEELAGHTIGVTPGGLPRAMLSAQKSAATLVDIENYAEGFKRVSSGEIDAIAADRWVAASTLERLHITNIASVGRPFAELPGSIALRKGQGELAGQINAAVRTLRANGTLSSIEQQWRPQEVLFVSRERINRIIMISAAVLLSAVLGGMALWVRVLRQRVADEQRAKEALRHSEAKYRDVVENANDIIFTVDTDGYCVAMNRAGLEIAGLCDDNARGVNLRQLVVPEQVEMASAQLRRVLGGERVPTFELEIISRLGKRLTMELDAHVLHGAHGPVAVQGIARDVTARKELEGQLRQAQKMEAIGRLAGGIAHDFNNLLTAILGYAELLGDRLDINGKDRADLDEIQRAARSAASLTRQLLIFSRKNVIEPTAVDVNDVVEALNRILRRVVGEHIEFSVRPCDAAARIWADAGQIEQVIMNLVINARDAMPTGGALSIATERVTLDEAQIRVKTAGASSAFVKLTVSDTGCGMSPDVQAQIFTPFFTTKDATAGTGLGLSMVHGIVQQSGGWIDVDSAPGRGSTFVIYLPLISTPAAVGAAQVTDTVVTHATGTILFVEDDESIRAMGARALRKYGYSVLTARHASEAMFCSDMYDGDIDLLLTDIVMPGLHGPALADRLTDERPGLRVLYTSGHSDEQLALRDVRAAGAAFMQKPYTPESLARRVHELMAS